MGERATVASTRRGVRTPKGAASRARILESAVELSRQVGLDGLSLGMLAEATGLSKSGILRHFGTRASLQAATIDALAGDFHRLVLAPADEPASEERLRRLYDGFLGWMAIGCPLSAATFSGGSLSDPLQAHVAKALAAWREILREAVEDAAQRGQIPPTADAAQASFELVGGGLAYRQTAQSRDEEAARAQAWRAFDRIFR